MKRILVVDDELGARTLIGIMLDRGGFEVLKAADANEALGIHHSAFFPEQTAIDQHGLD